MDVAVTRSAKVGKERLVGRRICTSCIVRAFLKPRAMRLAGIPITGIPATLCRSANVLGVFGRRRTVRFKGREPVGAKFRVRISGTAADHRVSARARCRVRRIRAACTRSRIIRIVWILAIAASRRSRHIWILTVVARIVRVSYPSRRIRIVDYARTRVNDCIRICCIVRSGFIAAGANHGDRTCSDKALE